MRSLLTTLLVLASTSQLGLSSPASDSQAVLAPSPDAPKVPTEHVVDQSILAALERHSDPVDALLFLQPELADKLAEPRLLHVFGEREPAWMTIGDKMRLRRTGKKFMDVTDYQDVSEQQVETFAGKANLPNLTHQRLIKPLLPQVSTERMHDVLEHLTSYYNRFYDSVIGEHSAQWLHDHIAEIIDRSPFHTHISLEYFTHSFPQPSIIARFEPKVRNFSMPLTILGAHQDSANYLFPLLPAPGADDDCSGTVSILEAFRVLALSGYTPRDGPVEFHWYAAEEAGLLGSQPVARYKKDSGAKIGAMMEFDMTAFVARNATESIGFVKTDADEALTDWAVKLAKEYISIPAKIYELGAGAGSDYRAYTQLNYPATFATEGDPMHNGFPGDSKWFLAIPSRLASLCVIEIDDSKSHTPVDPYIHGVKDTMHVDDSSGFFSIDHMARFSELAIAFVVEQAGWDNTWR
ncbi:hypothetical protein BJ170DRAFT_133642 [Xylariales sp. AK1849]|nr:hypothetical protein BJ170DRAFT_133642 [Xylariales sp. AK1849]